MVIELAGGWEADVGDRLMWGVVVIDGAKTSSSAGTARREGDGCDGALEHSEPSGEAPSKRSGLLRLA